MRTGPARERHLHPGRRSRGISLIEAMVAVSVMGVGTLAVLGVQATLRANSDLSKQRSEAVRIAQEQMEDRRGFADLAAYDVITPGAATVTGVNATFTVTREIVDPAAASVHAPRLKSMRVSVAWQDRAGQTQQVQMTSVLHGMPPALAGSMAIPANLAPVVRPAGRHPSIPIEAQPMGDSGTSRYTPPGAPDGVSWIFSNVTGFIVQTCTSSLPPDCTPANLRLLAGSIRFGTAVPAPEGSDASETPAGFTPAESIWANALSVAVDLSTPSSAVATCYAHSDVGSSSRRYACAVPVNSNGEWSGRSRMVGFGGTAPPLADSVADVRADRYRVCRYTPVRGCQPTVPRNRAPVDAGTTIWGLPGATAVCTEPAPQTTPPTLPRKMRNDDHPLDFVEVAVSLRNQNFLVRRAPDGCPADGPSPFLNTNTWHHQPAS